MNPPKSLLIKIITRGALVVGLGVSIVFIPNLSIFDEDLLPEIAERLGNPPNTDIEGNAASYLYGIAAASDKDPQTVGKAVVARLQSKHAKGEMANLTEQETIEFYGGTTKWDDEWSEIYSAASCNPREKSDCFGELLVQIKANPISNPRLLVQRERYNKIIRFPHLMEDLSLMDYTSPLPNYYLVMQLGKINQASAYQESGLDGLIKSSQQDMQFWRMALSESQPLLGKMVAIATLRRNLSALSYALSNEPNLSSTQIQNLQTLLTPLTKEETNIAESFVAELRFSTENWKTAPKKIPEGESVILWLLTQPTANTNLFYRHTLKPTFALSQLSAKDFYEQAQTPTKAITFSRLNPYNLGGKIYLSKNWQYSPYIGRAHDLAGLYSLIALQLELKVSQPQDTTAAIKSSSYQNPYTDNPFDYDPETKMLGFRCFDVKDVCRINL